MTLSDLTKEIINMDITGPDKWDGSLTLAKSLVRATEHLVS
jgi:hypothetical protein